jgi:hypothetical protein
MANGRHGLVVCIDEAQDILPAALSTLKNAVQPLSSFMIVLSLRLVSDTGGAARRGRELLETRAADAGGDIGAARMYGPGTPMGPFETEQEVIDFFERRLRNNQIQFDPNLQLRIGEVAERTPREMRRIAEMVFKRAKRDQRVLADTALLDQTFPEINPDEMKQVVDLLTVRWIYFGARHLGVPNLFNRSRIRPNCEQVTSYCQNGGGVRDYRTNSGNAAGRWWALYQFGGRVTGTSRFSQRAPTALE